MPIFSAVSEASPSLPFAFIISAVFLTASEITVSNNTTLPVLVLIAPEANFTVPKPTCTQSAA